MTAKEYFDTEDDGFRYELVHGVMVMSPSATPEHQETLVEIVGQAYLFLRQTPTAKIWVETDVLFGKSESGEDIVYRPELVIFLKVNKARTRKCLVGVPDIVVEIISRESRRYDSETKFADYERFGVKEYWLIDPLRRTMTFYRLDKGRFVEIPVQIDRFRSTVLVGFELDLSRVRATF